VEEVEGVEGGEGVFEGGDGAGLHLGCGGAIGGVVGVFCVAVCGECCVCHYEECRYG